MIYHDGVFYLFAMFHKDDSDKYNNVHLATSVDGVHFEDRGCVVEDFPDCIWAMKVYKGKDAFYMNSGSFTPCGKQAMLKFWRSENLIDWEYMQNLDIVSPDLDNERIRLDCMNVVEKDGKYFGYATGQYGFFKSDDGVNWEISKANFDYFPFPEYNTALGGFEIADCIETDGKFYMFCGGFGHLGTDGYGVFVYESENPQGPFRPHLPNYRINGTSGRWVNIWERCFKVDGRYLANNYMYDGYTMEYGKVYLPPIKRVEKDEMGLHLEWWEKNDALYGRLFSKQGSLSCEAQAKSVLDDAPDKCEISEKLSLPDDACVIDFDITLSENQFTRYSAGGFYLEKDENEGTAVIFDTYGRVDICRVKDGKIIKTEDSVGYGSCAPYYFEGNKTYRVKILQRLGMFEIYVDGRYLQTFNNAYERDMTSQAFKAFAALSLRRRCVVENIEIFEMDI